MNHESKEACAMRKKKTRVFDLSAEIDDAMKDWDCPLCRTTYHPPLTQYWSGLTECYVCEPCLAKIEGGA